MFCKTTSTASLLFLITASQCYASEDELVVKLWNREGRIRGHTLKSGNGNDYYAFQEIPFAEPPIGENRFKLPKEPKDWNDILNTTKNTKICYQRLSKYANLEISEDCLYLNVYTPVKPGTDSSLPVLFWIHGGGFTAESSTYEYYGPKYVMDHEVVVVTTNYRLGPFGFLTTEDDVIPANLGLRDLQFALRWTNRNIHLFGGNPGQVTVVGESAGSMAIGALLLGPWQGEQLFHAAIMQSGSPLYAIYVNNARETAFKLGQSLDNNFVSEESDDLLEVLQKASAADILHVQGKRYGTVIEKDGDFSYPPVQSFMDGNFKKIPVLIGFTSEEWVFFGMGDPSKRAAQYDKNVSLLVNDQINMSPENRILAGTLIHKIYTNTSFQEDIGAYVRFFSDNSFSTPTLKQVELGSIYSTYYLYQFSYKGQLGGFMSVSVPGAERVGHSEDLYYMWDNGTYSDLSKFPEEDLLTQHRFLKMWTNFVKYFDPTPSEDALLPIKWTKVEKGSLDYLNFNSTLEMLSDPKQYKYVKEVLDEYMEPPYLAY